MLIDETHLYSEIKKVMTATASMWLGIFALAMVFLWYGYNFATTGILLPMDQAIVIPKNYTDITPSLQHTIFIGTTDNPTINGGIVNAADGMPINRNVPEPKVTLPAEAVKNVPKQEVVEANTTKKFQDDWATSHRVKALLKEAARDGKLEYVLQRVEEMGLPASVATVPMIESAYRQKAVSSKGAAGVWQLMPSVAKDYGIANHQREHLASSTEAALSLLNTLHKKFGSWELAFAAYHAGAHRVQKALRKNPTATSVQQLELPKETKIYVQRMMQLNLSLAKLVKK